MSSEDEAKSAIMGLNGSDLKGQRIDVDEVRPRRINYPVGEVRRLLLADQNDSQK